MRRLILLGWVLVGLLAASCAAPITPVDTKATENAVAQNVLATLTAVAAAETTQTPVVSNTTKPGGLCTATTDGLNLRSGPGTAFAPPLRALPAGTRLIPIAYSPVGDPEGQWIQVQLEEGSAVGWVSATAVSCNVDPASLPNAPVPVKVTAPPPPPPQATNTPTATPGTNPTITVTPTATPVASSTFTPTPTATPTASPTSTSKPTANQGTIQLPPGTHPNGMAMDVGRGHLFVAGRNTNTLYVIDVEQEKIIKEIRVGQQPFGVVFLNDYVHVANFGSGSVTVVDAATLEPVPVPGKPEPFPETAGIQSTESQPAWIAADPEHNRVAVSLYAPQTVYHRHVYFYGVEPDGSLGRWMSVNGLQATAYGIAVLPAKQRAFVGSRDYGEVVAIDTATGNIVEAESLRNLGYSPLFVGAHQGNRYLYVTHGAPDQPADSPSRLSAYFAYHNGQLPTLITTIDVGNLGSAGGYVAEYPGSPNYSDFNTTVWVSAGGKVTVYDPTLATVLRVFDTQDGIGPSPFAIAFDTTRRQAYIADTTTDKITVLGGW